jgi:hypothetical protein
MEAVVMADISPPRKGIIKSRYIGMVNAAERDYRRVYIMYLIFTNLITISGVMITALISLGELSWLSPTGSMVIFWLTWVLGISLTLANKWIYTFNVHKKYVLNSVLLEKLYNEGWSFISGIGRYSTCANDDEKFLKFCTRVEKLKVKSIEPMMEMEAQGANASVANLTISSAESPNGPVDRRPVYLTKINPIANGLSKDAIVNEIDARDTQQYDKKKDIVVEMPYVSNSRSQSSDLV